MDAFVPATFIECQFASYPINYLDILGATRRLPIEAFQHVDRLTDQLPTWKVSMMLKVGCLALVNLVLAAIPLHQLMAGGKDPSGFPLGGQSGC